MVSGRLKPEARFRLTNRFSYFVRRLCKRDFITVLIEGVVSAKDQCRPLSSALRVYVTQYLHDVQARTFPANWCR